MIHLIVGKTGSGKTTYSIELKKKVNGIRFSIDKWNNTLFYPDIKPYDGIEWVLEKIERSEKIIMELVQQLENSKTDSILDLGLSKFEHREKFRKFAELNGYKLKIHFLDVSKETRLKRVMKRNIEKGATFEFVVSEKKVAYMDSGFEIPNEKEIAHGIIIKE